MNLLKAEDPIAIFAARGGTPPSELKVSGNSITDLVTKVTRRSEEFVAFAGQDFSATLTYLGVENSVLFDFSGDGKSATVQIPSANFTKVFKAKDAHELSDQLGDFLKSDGSTQLAQLRKHVNTESPAGVTDGNPLSTTAQLGAMWLPAFSDSFTDHLEPGKNSINLSYAQTPYQAGDFSGVLHSGSLSIYRKVNETIEIIALLPYNYQLIEDAEVLGLGGGLALPTTLYTDETRKFRLKLTPFCAGFFRISEKLASGGGVLSYGLNATTEYKISPALALRALTQFNFYEGVPLEIEGYELDQDIEQHLTTFGGELDYRLSDKWLIRGHFHQMHYLKLAAVSDWGAVGTQLRYKINQSLKISALYEHVTGNDFEANRYTCNLTLRF